MDAPNNAITVRKKQSHRYLGPTNSGCCEDIRKVSTGIPTLVLWFHYIFVSTAGNSQSIRATVYHRILSYNILVIPFHTNKIGFIAYHFDTSRL